MACLAFGAPIRQVGINWLGPYVRRGRAQTLAGDVAVSMAGIAANVALASILWHSWHSLAVVNAQLALVSSAPLPGTDLFNAWRTLSSKSVL